MKKKNTKGLKSYLENMIASHIARLPKSGIRDFFELVNNMDDVISLGIGEPDFVTPWHIREYTVYAIEQGYTTYTSNLGLLELREEICKYQKNFNSLSYNPETECIITVGVSEALDLILRALINPGDEIIYHEPCYVSYMPEIIMAHGRPITLTTNEKDDFAINPSDLERLITSKTKAVLLNFPCNPTGADLTQKQKRAIAEIVKKHNLILITDEIYSELTYEERTKSIASFPGMKERTVLLSGFSKAFAMTGFRLGYACGPETLIDAMMKIHQYSMLCASIVAQKAGIEAYRHGNREMERMKQEYKQRRNIIVKHLNEIGLKCFKPKGAFYVFPEIKTTGLNSVEFATRLLKEQNVAVVPGTAFGKCGEGFIRCSYATAACEIIEAMKRIKTFVNSL